MSQRILVTGAAGFIGFHLSRLLLTEGRTVLGVDSVNSYYDQRIKLDRLNQLRALNLDFQLRLQDVSEFDSFCKIAENFKPDVIVHLAAQAGVRYSLEDPFAYQKANVEGTLSILETCRRLKNVELIYASSSSVYGNNTKVPFKESDRVDSPVSLYAATKRSNELMAYTYSHLFGLKTTGLRFFTVYGPWGRPDMAYWSFVENILNDRPIKIFGEGLLSRDFTYVDDIVRGIEGLLKTKKNDATSLASVLNIGNSDPVTVNDFVEILERLCNRPAIKISLPPPPGDVQTTYADCSELERLTGYRPKTRLEDGLREFVNWYRDYYKL
jgi:UDP-glucuronate 4-epimerase